MAIPAANLEKELGALEAHIKSKLGSKIMGSGIALGELTLEVAREEIVPVVEFLRDDDDCRFVCLIDICGADYPGREARFDVVYHLLSPTKNARIRLRIATDEATPVPSLTGVFPGAEWFERETFDLYGIVFSNHPDLRRILTDYGFQGYPLRKDFPLTGYVEVRYDDELKKVVYEPVKLMQGFRNFDFLSPWEGMDSAIPGDEKASKAED